jgi:hypothetical protein
MVYAGVDMLSDELAEALESEGYGVWLANWGVQTRYNGAYSFWQYSSKGRVEGIETQVDMNVRYIVSPGRVTGLKAEALSAGTSEKAVRLTWDRMPQAYGYIVYRYDQKAGGYIEYARTRGASATEFIDNRPAEDGRYAVCAVVRQSGTDYRGGLSGAVSLPRNRPARTIGLARKPKRERSRKSGQGAHAGVIPGNTLASRSAGRLRLEQSRAFSARR